MLIHNFEELKKTVKIGKSGAWEAIEPFIQDAQRFYIEPYLGIPLLEQLENINDIDSSDKLKQLLEHTVRALGPLSYSLATHESSIGFGDAGHTVTRTTTVAPASDEKVKRAEMSAEYRGWQNLEYLIVYLESKKSDFPEWGKSHYCQIQQSKYFSSAVEFQELGMVNISNSRLTYEKLLPLIRRIEITEIANLVSVDIPDISQTDIDGKTKKLISYIRPYIASRVAALYTSQASKEQRVINGKPEFRAVIRPLYNDIQDTGNYYEEQTSYWRSEIINLMQLEFNIDKTGSLNWNSSEKKLFCDIG